MLRFKNGPTHFNNFVDDFSKNFPSIFRDDVATPGYRTFIPVNVLEKETGYQLEVIAPGFDKTDFKVSIDKDRLSVSAEKKRENEEKKAKVLKREYQFQGFSRSFTISENIDSERIEAKYENGVLTLNLPRREEVKPQVKTIDIA
jgi:HSP20 family protein